MKTTRYFVEQVLPRRPYIDPAWCLAVIAAPLHRDTQADGRLRFFGPIVDPRDGKTRMLRVVTLDDGQTIHNAFFDRGFREDTR